MRFALSRFFFFYLLLIPSSLYAKDITVYFIGHAPPLFFIRNTEVKGLLVDLLKESLENKNSHKTSADENIKLHFSTDPWLRAQELVHKNPDSMIVMVKTDDRVNRFNFSRNHIFENEQAVYKKIPDNFSDSKKGAKPILAQVKGYEVGGPQSFPGYEILPIENLEQALRLLDLNRTNRVLGNTLTIECIGKSLGLKVSQEKSIVKSKVYLATSKNFDKKLLEAFDSGFEKIRANFVDEKTKFWFNECSNSPK